MKGGCFSQFTYSNKKDWPLRLLHPLRIHRIPVTEMERRRQKFMATTYPNDVFGRFESDDNVIGGYAYASERHRVPFYGREIYLVRQIEHLRRSAAQTPHP